MIAFFLVAMLLVPVQAGDVSAQQTQQEDPKQPNANNTTMYLYHDGFADAWSHFSDNDTESAAEGELREEDDNGLININLRFRMKPDLDKRLLMTSGGEFRGNFKIDVGGDWTNDNNGACNNDCENLNITVFRGASEVWTNQFTGIQQGEQTVPFTFAVTEDHAEWNGRDDSPIVEVTMKLKGNYQETSFITANGEPAYFAIKLGMESKFEMPVDADSWSEEFQAGDDMMMDDEDTPGFTLVTASAALGMALFMNKGREEDEA